MAAMCDFDSIPLNVKNWPLCGAPHNGYYVYCRIMCTAVLRDRKYRVVASAAGRWALAE